MEQLCCAFNGSFYYFFFLWESFRGKNSLFPSCMYLYQTQWLDSSETYAFPALETRSPKSGQVEFGPLLETEEFSVPSLFWPLCFLYVYVAFLLSAPSVSYVSPCRAALSSVLQSLGLRPWQFRVGLLLGPP